MTDIYWIAYFLIKKKSMIICLF